MLLNLYSNSFGGRSMSYREFIANLGLAETDLSKILYHLYLDCLNEMIEKDDE